MPTQRLTIKDAAAHLGVSENTIRRRLKSGKLQGEQEQTDQGYRWLILIDVEEEDPESEPDPQEPSQADTQTGSPTVNQEDTHPDTQRLIDRLTSENDRLLEEVAAARQEAADARAQAARERERSDTLILTALQRIEALSASVSERDEEPGEDVEEVDTGAPEGFWRRLHRWMKGTD